MDNQWDLGHGRRRGPLPADDLPAGGRAPRAAGDVSVPMWGLAPETRATLLQVVQGGGKADCRGSERDDVSALLAAGYLAPYGEGRAILTPAALRAIAAEVDRRAARDPGSGGEAGERSAGGDPAQGTEL
ncbi:MAG TPA: hypothetical protein VFA45_21335 [Actinomycetes bacterium]|nr:hypothetical protein [Actinomycetes bacterium]